MNIIRNLPYDLRNHIYNIYIETIATYEERICLNATPRKIEITKYEKIGRCVKNPAKHPTYENVYEIILRVQSPAGGLLRLGKLRVISIAKTQDNAYIITHVHDA